ncbi:MCE family protein [Nocardioides pantholopis]|uniref:MCE family protein n=1 Tax=Nocardioides pantholopis TaxID=2483798 RepID=UPI0013DE4538|nr:MCE family protein [Nocardioides pantholopis]
MSRAYKISDLLLGLGYLVVTGALVLGALLVYDRTFVDSVEVTLAVDDLGNALQEGSDVKLNGVPVGRVEGVRATGSGADVALALEPDAAESLAPGTVARLLPKTLFGERYVALLPPENGSGGLSEGDTIQQDASSEAVALDAVLDELLPLLESIQPEKLAATLGEFSTLLRGRGEEIGDTLVAWSDYLERLNPHVPQMTEDLARLAEVAETYDAAAPELLSALDSLTVTSATVVEERSALADAYARVITAADASTGWVRRNRQTIEVLADESREALESVRPYARQFPCLLRAARDFIPVMDETLGAGTDEPGMHVRLNVVEGRGKYRPGVDAPSYVSGAKPRCPYATGSRSSRPATPADPAGAVTDEPAPIPAPPTEVTAPAADDLGEANSPAENQLIAELLAPTRGVAPAAYPRWASLLVGPVLRGTEVSLR